MEIFCRYAVCHASNDLGELLYTKERPTVQASCLYIQIISKGPSTFLKTPDCFPAFLVDKDVLTMNRHKLWNV